MGSRVHSRVDVHVRCVEGALGLGGHVVIGVVSLHHAGAIPSVESLSLVSCSFHHADAKPCVEFFPSEF